MVTRVLSASVRVDGELISEIGPGLLVLAGIAPTDDDSTITKMATKIVEMRLFPDEAGRFAHSLREAGGSILVVSQFTLFADTRHGRRPGFTQSAPPEIARSKIDAFIHQIRSLGVIVASGRFGEHMTVQSINDGPVTILLDM